MASRTSTGYHHQHAGLAMLVLVPAAAVVAGNCTDYVETDPGQTVGREDAGSAQPDASIDGSGGQEPADSGVSDVDDSGDETLTDAGISDAPPVLSEFDAAGCEHPPVVANCTDGWCEIPAGCFVMGSPESEWGHPMYAENQVAVTLTRSFLIGQYEVTQEQWIAHGLPNPSMRYDSGEYAGEGDCTDDPRCPVGNVNWFEAAAFANLLSESHEPPLAPCYELRNCSGELGSGMTCWDAVLSTSTVYECEGFRLPTDAEWEYAARAGTRTAFYSGDIQRYAEAYPTGECRPDPNLERIAWYCHNSGGITHPVGGVEPNGWGLYDMSGNAFEWNNDQDDGLPSPATVDPRGTVGAGANRYDRGGGFNAWSSLCRSASQGGGSWHSRGPGLGFRLVRTLHEDADAG